MSIHIECNIGDIAESVLLPGDPLRAKYIAENFLKSPKLYSQVRNMYGYTGLYKGCPVSVQGTGMGMPSMGIYSWELISEYRVKNLIRIGTAGSFNRSMNMGDVVISMSSSTDSNYAHSFKVPGTLAPCADWDLMHKAATILAARNATFRIGNTLSCDVFYETDENWWKPWEHMGILAVEMEAAALYMNSAYLGAKALAMMTVTDHFITGAKATTEERTTANEKMILAALDVAVS